MNCKQISSLSPDYLAGELDEKTKAELDAHVSRCAKCRQELQDMRNIWEDLQRLPAEQPTESLRQRFYTMLAAYEEGLNQAEPTLSWTARVDGWLAGWWPRKPILQLAIAASLLLVGLVAGRLQNAPGANGQDFTRLQNEIHEMRQLVTLSLLQQQSPAQRLRGVSWTYRIDRPDSEILSALLQTLNHDPNVNVRLAAVDALYLFRENPMVRKALVRSLSRQTSPLVQIALIDLMVEIRETRATDALKKLIQDDKLNQAVRQQAEWGLKQLKS